jgi:hypothetical protein
MREYIYKEIIAKDKALIVLAFQRAGPVPFNPSIVLDKIEPCEKPSPLVTFGTIPVKGAVESAFRCLSDTKITYVERVRMALGPLTKADTSLKVISNTRFNGQKRKIEPNLNRPMPSDSQNISL